MTSRRWFMRLLLCPRLCAPRLLHHAQPVAVGDLADRRVVVATCAHRLDQIWKQRHVTDPFRHGRPVEVRTESDLVFTETLDQRVEMVDHNAKVQVGSAIAHGMEESAVEVQSDDSLSVANGVELALGEIAG